MERCWKVVICIVPQTICCGFSLCWFWLWLKTHPTFERGIAKNSKQPEIQSCPSRSVNIPDKRGRKGTFESLQQWFGFGCNKLSKGNMLKDWRWKQRNVSLGWWNWRHDWCSELCRKHQPCGTQQCNMIGRLFELACDLRIAQCEALTSFHTVSLHLWRLECLWFFWWTHIGSEGHLLGATAWCKTERTLIPNDHWLEDGWSGDAFVIARDNFDECFFNNVGEVILVQPTTSVFCFQQCRQKHWGCQVLKIKRTLWFCLTMNIDQNKLHASVWLTLTCSVDMCSKKEDSKESDGSQCVCQKGCNSLMPEGRFSWEEQVCKLLTANLCHSFEMHAWFSFSPTVHMILWLKRNQFQSPTTHINVSNWKLFHWSLNPTAQTLALHSSTLANCTIACAASMLENFEHFFFSDLFVELRWDRNRPHLATPRKWAFKFDLVLRQTTLERQIALSNVDSRMGDILTWLIPSSQSLLVQEKKNNNVVSKDKQSFQEKEIVTMTHSHS